MGKADIPRDLGACKPITPTDPSDVARRILGMPRRSGRAPFLKHPRDLVRISGWRPDRIVDGKHEHAALFLECAKDGSTYELSWDHESECLELNFSFERTAARPLTPCTDPRHDGSAIAREHAVSPVTHDHDAA